jgi:hypothetical protein
MVRVDINPAVWGYSGWVFLVAIAKSLGDNPTQEEQRSVATFFSSVGPALPCGSCRVNFSKAPPPRCDNSTQALQWLFTVYSSHHKGETLDVFVAKYTYTPSSSSIFFVVSVAFLIVAAIGWFCFLRSPKSALNIHSTVSHSP